MIDLNAMIPEGYQPAPEFPWSEKQKDVFAACESSNANLSIEAVAGSGKTTTILRAMGYTAGNSILFLAFSKAIATELASKVPPNCEAKTFHSLGYALLMRIMKDCPVKIMDKYKNNKIIKVNMSPQMYDDIGYDVTRILSMAKNHALGVDKPAHAEDFERLIDNQEMHLDEQYINFVLANLPQWYLRSIDVSTGNYDFDDMVYQPILHKKNFKRYDTIFVDEAQDLNYLQHLILTNLAAQGARIIAVGDSHQAIYGFRGADHESMSNLAELFQAKRLPLSVSYRCPDAVVKIAQGFVPHIEPRPGASAGTVIHLDYYPDPSSYAKDGLVICRNNAPIFQLGMQFLKARVPCQLRTGHGKELIYFIKRFDAESTHDLEIKLNGWYNKELKAAEDKNHIGRIHFLEERFDIVKTFIAEYDNVDKITRAIQSLLYSTRGTILCTIHKAKGLESNNVYILRHDLLPSKFAKTSAQLQQEYNLEYVAVTRSLSNLTYLPGEPQ